MKNETIVNFATQIYLEEIGKRLRLARKRRKDSLKKASERLGCSISTIQKMENGNPSVQIKTLLQALIVYGYEKQVSEIGLPEKDARINELDFNQRKKILLEEY